MSFLAPWGFLALAAAVPIVALYFLKLKRRRVPVSSTWLWERSINDISVNAPFQRLQASLLLFVQLLLVALAAFALARPSGSGPGPSGKGLVILIDRSASMSARDVKPSRLERARELARETVEGLAEGDQAMIIAFAARAEVLMPFAADRRRAASAIDGIQPGAGRTRIQEAFQMALSGLRAPAFRQKEIVVISDGAFGPVATPTEGVPVRFIAVGGKIRNAAITALDVRRPGGPGEPWTVFAQLDCFSEEPMEFPLELYIDARLQSVKTVSMKPSSSQAVVFELKAEPDVVELVIAAQDDIDADNRAWFVVRKRDLKVLLVTEGNFFVERALGGLPGLVVDKAAPASVTDKILEGYDVAVFDSVLPPSIPEGRYFFLGAVPPWKGIEIAGTIQNPDIFDWDRRHRATRLINFSGIMVKNAPKLKLSDPARAIAEAQEGPLLFTWQEGKMRAIVVGFKVFDSDWPLKLSFPLMISSAIEWLRSDDAAEWRAHTAPGEPLLIRLDPGETSVEVTEPGGRTEKVSGRPREEVSVGRTERPGIYTIKHAETVERVAVNLLDPDESSGRVVDTISLGDTAVRAQAPGPPLRQDAWKYFVWAALAVLFAEWWIYHRRI